MSLHTLANHLQTAGRGDDSLLVHMTPNEVSGLQSLAMAHGGSLSINPQTGLPEAGFLSGILPMLAGAALAATGVGAPMAALMVGGAGTVATGSLSKGLMMGLGAYGGAGLGAGLMGGAAAAAPAASALSTAVSPAVGAGQALTGAGLAGSPAAAAAAAPAAAPAAGNFAGISGTNVNAMTGLPPPSAPTIPNPVNTMQQGQAAYADYMKNNPVVNAPAPSVQSATSGFVDKLKSMPTKAFDLLTGSGPDADKAREEFIKQNKNYMLMGGLGVLGASRDDPRKPKETQYDIHDYDWNTRRFSPSSQVPGSTGERTYFAADGGLMGLPVEQMSQQNAMSDNTRYPMAFQNTPSYATPSQRPISQNVVYPATDTDTTPYSGAERGMANGGVVALAAGGAAAPKLTPQEIAYNTVQASLKNNIKPYDLSKVVEPKGGFTAANTVSTYNAVLTKERNELINTEKLLTSYVDAKGNPKPGYDAVVDSLRGAIEEQRNNLIDAINTVYEKIPKTDIDFSDPAKAALQKTNQTNEFNAINSLLNSYINNTPSLKGTDFAKDYANKLAKEDSQKQETTLYADKVAPALKALSAYTGKDAKGQDITGTLTNLTSGWKAENTRQSEDVTKLKAALVNAGLMDAKGNFTPAADKYAGLTGVAKSALDKQTSEVNLAADAQQKALQEFGTSTARGSTGIGSRSLQTAGGGNREDIQAQIDEIMANPAQSYTAMGGSQVIYSDAQQKQLAYLRSQLTKPKEVLDPVTGTFGPEKISPKYVPIAYNSVTATKGWDTASKVIEPDDVTRVFEEVAGRKPTSSELTDYVGDKLSVQQLADSVNKLPDLNLAKQFTDKELQEQAKYYWGREMTTGELANYKSKKLGSFAAVRNALTSEKMYVDNLNNINKAIVDKQNTPVLPAANRVDISSAFVDVLGRRPTKSEVDSYIEKKINKNDLIKELEGSPEYERKLYQTEYDKYGNAIEYDKNGKEILKDRNGKVIKTDATGNVTADNVITDGNEKEVVVTPTGGGTGLVPPITYTVDNTTDDTTGIRQNPVSPKSPDVLTGPSTGNVTTGGITGNVITRDATTGTTGAATTTGTGYTPGTMTREEMDAYAKNYAAQPATNSPYKPLTGPQFSIAGSLPYQDINKQLGLTGLYKQMSDKMPELQQGLNFNPNQAQAMASPFANVTPGIVSLQSTATPQAYNPVTSFDPTRQAYSPGLSPEEQAYLSMLQSQSKPMASGGMTSYNLGGYSDGGRLLKGPGDGVSDSIPATIGDRQPARLADGEFVVPARIVSELGNGSTDAGARKLYAMMERIQRARRKTVGKNKVAVKSGADKLLPA